AGRGRLADTGLGRLALGVVRAVDLDGRQDRPGAPVPLEDDVVDRTIVTPAGEHRGPGGADLLAILERDDLEGAGEVDLGRQVDRQPRGPQGASEADRALQEATPVDRLARPRSGRVRHVS